MIELLNYNISSSECLFAAYVAILCAIIVYIWTYFRRIERLNVPQVEGGYPILGSALDMIKNPPWEVMTEWTMKYGPLYLLHLFGRECLVVSDPALLKVLF